MFALFIALIIWIFYDYFTTPNARLIPLLVFFFFIITTFIFDFGEFLGKFMKKKNFITEGGLVAVYHHHYDYESGMSEYFFTTQKRYGEYIGNEDFAENNVVTRFLLKFTNTRMYSIVAPTYLFDEVPDSVSDVPEGAIIFRGTFRKGIKVLNPIEALKIKLQQAYGIISEFATIAEKAKAVSEQRSVEQSKDFIDNVIKLGNAVQNLPAIQQPMQKFERG